MVRQGGALAAVARSPARLCCDRAEAHHQRWNQATVRSRQHSPQGARPCSSQVAVLAVLVAAIIVLMIVLRHRLEMRLIAMRVQRAAMSELLSPDRSHWWNGSTWVACDNTAPPNAPK